MRIAVLLVVICLTLPVRADLREEIATADAAMFAAFNAHDAKKLASFFTSDLEFYQDTEGLAFYPDTVKDFTNMFASATDIRRELLQETFEVYPIKNYGAVELGTHRFCH